MVTRKYKGFYFITKKTHTSEKITFNNVSIPQVQTVPNFFVSDSLDLLPFSNI
jgi:hypothetical protein